MDRRSNWLPLGGPSKLLLPGRSPEFAALFEVVSLRELFSTDVAGHKGVAVLVDAIGDVLAGLALKDVRFTDENLTNKSGNGHFN